MFKKIVTKPLPPSAQVLPGGRSAVLASGKTVGLNENGRIVIESSSWYTSINGKVVPLLPKKKESETLEAELRGKARRVELGVELEVARQDEPLADLVSAWLDELEEAGRHPGHVQKLKGRIGQVLKVSGLVILSDLGGQEGALKLTRALEKLGGRRVDQAVLQGAAKAAETGTEFKPRKRIPLPDEEKLTPATLRSVLGISATAFSKMAAANGFVGNGEKGKAKRYTRAEALEMVALRDRGRSASTRNGFRVAVLSFCRWLQKQGKLIRLPYLGLGFDESKDRRRVRRTITWAECRKLAQVVAKSGALMGMEGAERSCLYLVAFASLLRARALRELQVGDCHFGDNPFVSVRGETDKTGIARACPLPPDVAKALKSLVRGRAKTSLVFNLPGQTGAMVRHDLKLAGIPFKTADGVVDLHSFRGSGATHLAEKGVPLDVVAKLGGWKDIGTIFKRYRRYTTQGLSDATRGAWA